MQYLQRCLQACLCLLLMSNQGYADETPLKLWFDKPATQWEAALPLGNGRLGAMVYGGVDVETIQLNEDTFWAGGPHNNLNPAAHNSLAAIRHLINVGDYTAASDMAEKTITSQGSQGMPYQTAGQLSLSFQGHEKYQNYYRDLDISNAVAHTRYSIGDINFERDVFTSFVDQVIVVHLRASHSGALNFALNLSHPDNMSTQANANEGTLLMQGTSNDHEGVKGQVRLSNLVKIVQHNGRLEAINNTLKISNASDVVLLVSMATNFVNYKDISADALTRTEQYLKAAEQKLTAAPNSFNERKMAHSKFYRHYFDRVNLNLGANEFSQQPTDQRIRDFANRHDPQLVSLYFQFGRYLLISSSQPGSQPANLQGLWNPHQKPAWDSKYTININTEMNYWPAEVTNLSELHDPLINLIRDLAETGKDSAQVMYGAHGWMTHHNTDIWRISGAVDRSWGAWPTSNAWLVQHLWQRYLYTGDKGFLTNIFPIMKGACEFFEDFLVKDERTGWLIVSPSMSPENTPKATGKKIAAGVTMDNQLVFELFTNSIAAANIIGKEKSSIKKWQTIIDQLPPMQIGQYHQLQEWQDDWDDPLDNHRHISHLYGLHPGNQISPIRTPELFNAARVTMEQRGDPSTGWSMNWKINFWARLLDGDRAFKLIREQIKPASLGGSKISQDGSTYPNMFDAHPPFQIDGNFGFTAGVVEMLAQSHDGTLHLLPALPQAWSRGEVKGLVMRGGFVVDMKWQRGQITNLKILSRLGGNLRLRIYAPLPKTDAFLIRPARGKNINPFYAVPQVKKPIKHTDKILPTLSLTRRS